MKGKALWAGVAAIATGLVLVAGSSAATTNIVTLTVNTTSDINSACTIANHKSTGTCSLRGAVLAADNYVNPNTLFGIVLAAKTYHLSLGELQIETAAGNLVLFVGKTTGKRLTPASVIDGSNNPRPSSVIEVDTPLQTYGVVITGGTGGTFDSGNGGGLWVQSALDMEYSSVRGNIACSSWTVHSCTGTYADGGGIYMTNAGSVTPHVSLYKTTITKNIAGQGGGIDNENHRHSSVFILNSHIDRNRACDTFSNGACIGDGDGGGIYDNGESLTLDGSTVNGNHAGSGAYNTGDGGGIYNDEDAMQLRHTVVNGNVAGYDGGGVYANNHGDFVDSTISHNVAGHGGGGIALDYLGTFKGTTISSNTAGGTFACTINGGTTTCLSKTKTTTGKCAGLFPTATKCQSNDGIGGGIYSDYEYPQLISSSVTGNLAVSLNGDAINCGGGLGGGIWTSWTLTMLAGSKVTGNTADCGGGIYNNYGSTTDIYTFDLANSKIMSNSALEDGGGIYTQGAGSGTLYGMTITLNKAGRKTGGVWNDVLGSVLFGPGNTITKNIGTGKCKNLTIPCR